METIFDYKVTDDELKNLFGITMSRSEYIDGMEQSKAYEHLYYLFLERGNKKRAKKYLDKLPDDTHKFFQIMNVDWSSYKHF
jgi:hypothetical protein